MKNHLFVAIITFVSVCLTSCSSNQQKQSDSSDHQAQTETELEGDKDWIVLFDGSNLDHWKAYNSDSISSQWQMEEDALVFNPNQNTKHSENLVTKNTFTNFHLMIDFKISEGGNSGIMWAVQEKPSLKEPYETGPEIQITDNQRHPDAIQNGPSHQTGALYDMVAPKEDLTFPAGEWNTFEILVNHPKNKGEVYLNGMHLIDFPLHGEAWQQLVADSKFANWPHFASSPTGKIALQDHGNKVAFRNIKIKPLTDE